MATKIQVRRGLAASWTFENPVLSSGELGLETDTYKLKIGNGTTAWNSLDYFAIPLVTSASSSLVSYIDTQINSLIDASPGTLDTLNELAAAINDDPAFFSNIYNSITSASATAFNSAFSSASANTTYQINAASSVYLTIANGASTYVPQDSTGVEYIQDAVSGLFNHGFHTNLVATYKFPQFNVEIINPTVTVTTVVDNIIDKVCTANVLLTTPSAIFGVDFAGYTYQDDWNDQDIIDWVNNVELPKYEVK